MTRRRFSWRLTRGIKGPPAAKLSEVDTGDRSTARTQHFAFNDAREYLARLQALEATRVAQTAMREPQPLARPNCSDLVS